MGGEDEIPTAMSCLQQHISSCMDTDRSQMRAAEHLEAYTSHIQDSPNMLLHSAGTMKGIDIYQLYGMRVEMPWCIFAWSVQLSSYGTQLRSWQRLIL